MAVTGIPIGLLLGFNGLHVQITQALFHGIVLIVVQTSDISSDAPKQLVAFLCVQHTSFQKNGPGGRSHTGAVLQVSDPGRPESGKTITATPAKDRCPPLSLQGKHQRSELQRMPPS
jgi:hypothetical protein